MERITDTHIFFWGSFLSNWHKAKFEYKGKKFDNTEQAFMWEKAMYFNDKEIANDMLKTPKPAKAKELGRLVKGFDQILWFNVCFDIMVEINKAKYSQNEKLKKLLLSTGDKILVEASPSDTL